MYEGVIGSLGENNRPEIKYQLLHSAMDILKENAQRSTTAKLDRPFEVLRLVSDLWESKNEKYREVARRFLVQFTDCK